MRALVIHEGGRLVIEDRPVPEPVADQVLVRVHAAGINRADLHQRAGHYPAPPGVPADIPGLEFAGTVDAVGPAALTLQPGALRFSPVIAENFIRLRSMTVSRHGTARFGSWPEGINKYELLNPVPLPPQDYPASPAFVPGP